MNHKLRANRVGYSSSAIICWYRYTQTSATLVYPENNRIEQFHATEQNRIYAILARLKGIMKVFEIFTSSKTPVLFGISQNMHTYIYMK